MNWDRKWLVGFNAGKKTQVVSFDWPGATDFKMHWSVVEEKSYFKMLEWSFSSKLDWSSYLSLNLLNLPPRKLEP